MFLSKYSPDELKKARNVDLYDFLLRNFPDRVYRNGNSLKLNDNRSVTIKQGYKGFRDFGSGDNGGGIDLLMNHFGYTFNDAVALLLERGNVAINQPLIENKPKKITLPKKSEYDDTLIQEYLHNRGIPWDTIHMLLKKELMYEETGGHLVISSYLKTVYQVRNTWEKDKPKILASGRVHSDDFWYLRSGGKDADTAYICEGAIDAVSLYEISGRKPGFYISMGGVDNQQVIDRVVNDGRYKVVLAVDNDDSGRKCRERNPETENLKHLIPQHCKDWNEELMAGYNLVG